ncbi:MAG: glycosyltransferase [Pirellulaceae bacterium]
MKPLPLRRRWTREALRDFFDRLAPVRARWRSPGYHAELRRNYQFFIPPGARVLQIGCGIGDLLAELQPSFGVGVDFSPEMIRQARQRHPEPSLHFVEQVAEELALDYPPFDYIILSDTLTFLEDIVAVLRELRPYCHARTRIITNFFSRLWQPALWLAEQLGLRYPQPMLNWVTSPDVSNLLELAGFEVVLRDSRILLPTAWPVIAPFCNRVLATLPLLRHFCLTNWIVARLPMSLPETTGVSIVVPCRNEADNIPDVVRRWPALPGPSEIIFVEGHSSDDTWARCEQLVRDNPHRSIQALRQQGKGKGDAVRLGFAAARHEILVILDADLTVPPEEVTGFVEVLTRGHAEFVNGSRLLYPMDDEAMRFLNLLANKTFAWMFSWLLGQSVKDTLCGTKVLLRSDYLRLAEQRAYFGDIDPFGDFDLIFGAAKLGLKMRDYAIRYRARTYGTTQIRRFRDGWALLKLYLWAIVKMKWR